MISLFLLLWYLQEIFRNTTFGTPGPIPYAPTVTLTVLGTHLWIFMEASLGLEANFAESDIFIFLSFVKIFLTLRECLDFFKLEVISLVLNYKFDADIAGKILHCLTSLVI